MITDLNVNGETMQFLENRQEKVSRLGGRQRFLKTQKTPIVKVKWCSTLDFTILKTFCSSKGTIKKIKR